MNIGIDARLLERKITGIGRILKMLVESLPELDRKNKYYLFSYEKINCDNSYYTNISTVKSSLPQKIFAPIWINFILPKYLKQNKIDIFFSINTLTPLFKIKGIKYILGLHDVTYKADKSYHPFSYRKYLQFFTYFSVKNSDLIVTISHFSKQEILKYYNNVKPEKIKVIHLAPEKEFSQIAFSESEKISLKKSLGATGPIVLYLGMIENRKNIIGILRIADGIYAENQSIKFLLVGKIGHGGKQLLKEILKRKNVIYLGSVDDVLLNKIFNISSVFLFPSFYEGFGYPPVEAMQAGLPVLSSDNSSLKEVIEDGGILHQPDDYDAFVKDILKLLNDKEFYLEMRKRGMERAKHFSSKGTAKEFVDAFNSI